METGIHGGGYGFVLMCRGCSQTLINERAAIQNKWRRCRFVRVALFSASRNAEFDGSYASVVVGREALPGTFRSSFAES